MSVLTTLLVPPILRALVRGEPTSAARGAPAAR
jgi:hypothetical protein